MLQVSSLRVQKRHGRWRRPTDAQNDSYAPLYVLGIVAYPQKIVHQLYRFWYWSYDIIGIISDIISSGLRFKLETDEISHRSHWPAACIHYSDSIGFKMWFKDVTSQMMPDEGSDEVTGNFLFWQPSEVAKPVDIMKDLVAKQKDKDLKSDLKSAKTRDLSEKPKKHHGVTCPAECGNGWCWASFWKIIRDNSTMFFLCLCVLPASLTLNDYFNIL